MTSHTITTDKELDSVRGLITRHQANAARIRELGDPDRIDDRIETADLSQSMKSRLRAVLSGDVDPATRQLGESYLATWTATEAAEETYFESYPDRRWIQLLTPVADALRRPPDKAAEAFRFSTAPGLPAIVATCRPHEPWVMHSQAELDAVYEAIAGEIHCDLQISGLAVIDGKRYAQCVDWFRHVATYKPRQRPSSEAVDPRHEQTLQADHAHWAHRFISENFVTIPVARGDLLILMRVCGWCLGKFLSHNGVDPTKCVVEDSYSDGFGSLPWQVIDRAGQNSTHDEAPETDCDPDNYDEDDYYDEA